MRQLLAASTRYAGALVIVAVGWYAATTLWRAGEALVAGLAVVMTLAALAAWRYLALTSAD
jgi:hypothetical protein